MPLPPRTRLRAGATAVAAVSALVVLQSPARAAAPADGGTYRLSVTKSGKCLDVVAGSKDNGALLQQWGCTDAAWQRFTLKAAGSGVYNLVNANSGRCVDVPGGSTASGTRLQQWGCGDGTKPNQQWRLTASGSGTYQIVNVASGLCMSDQGASTASGAAIIQETCTHNTNKQWRFTPATGGTPSPGTGTAPTVAADGTGKYRTVQAAIDAVPANNTKRVVITVKPGTYREVVTVDKPFVTLQGLGSSPSQTVIVNNRSAGSHGTSGSYTAVVSGRDFTATNLTISNDFDETSTSSGHQAVALRLDGDRTTLTGVRVLGDQDTLLVNDSARAYVKGSYIEGTVDFVFGGGTAVFHDCDIYEKRSTGGPITAASTAAGKPYGFLFYRSRITGAKASTTTLGRPWRPDAQVLYRESTLSSTIKTAQPWTDMSGNSWKNARFFEYRNTGAGAGTNANRPQLSDAQAANHTPQKYLAGSDGWNPLG
ncbi:pectinesterase family protein [Planomonospora sp. ID82291]|uniref:pectinesterase family protein n=1 Tax=Planomonospora sp. ID82291 TaxID=2738136 RepID=UPI0018C373E3|nr:pectinesterase family protein [Planomonospora sp. ID82291]MBG0818053.1 RICIN domain-containing protein [Planomonospora sp. ID82291]